MPPSCDRTVLTTSQLLFEILKPYMKLTVDPQNKYEELDALVMSWEHSKKPQSPTGPVRSQHALKVDPSLILNGSPSRLRSPALMSLRGEEFRVNHMSPRCAAFRSEKVPNGSLSHRMSSSGTIPLRRLDFEEAVPEMLDDLVEVESAKLKDHSQKLRVKWTQSPNKGTMMMNVSNSFKIF